MQDFRKLAVWQRSHALAMSVFRASIRVPHPERYILVDQICRAASSVPTNIVEGTARRSDRDTARFLEIASSSAAELEYHLELMIELELLPIHELKPMQEEAIVVRRMLGAFIARLRPRKPPPNH